MRTFRGTVCDYLQPTPTTVAEVDADRLTLRYGTWVIEAVSRDGFLYEGHYGERSPNPRCTARLWRYPGKDGSVVLYWEWENQAPDGACGESVIRLFPGEVNPGTISEIPAELERVKIALVKSQLLLATDAPQLAVFLVADRRMGETAFPQELRAPGLYMLFCNSGRIARVGQAADRSLAVRLREYEPHKDGWFAFRWVAVIPIPSEFACLITPLEADLIRTLDPTENKKHRPRS